MSQTLEFIQTDRFTEEDNRRKSYNSHLSENYQRMMTMNSSDWANQLLEERFQSSPEANKRLQARRPITFENVVIPEDVRRETQQYRATQQTPVMQQYPATQQAPVMQQYPTVQQAPVMQQYPTVQQAPGMQATQTAYAPKTDFSDSIYTSSAYRAAALQKERAATAAAEIMDESLSMPTSTTLQYGRQAQAAMYTATAPVADTYAPAYAPSYAPAATPATRVETTSRTAAAAEDSRNYYAALAKKVVVALAVVFAVMMVVVIINSAVLNGLNMDIAALQEELSALQTEVAELQQAITQETSWASILQFIQQNGMIQAA